MVHHGGALCGGSYTVTAFGVAVIAAVPPAADGAGGDAEDEEKAALWRDGMSTHVKTEEEEEAPPGVGRGTARYRLMCTTTTNSRGDGAPGGGSGSRGGYGPGGGGGGGLPPVRISPRLAYTIAPPSERAASWLGLAVSALAGFGNGFNLAVLDLPAVRAAFHLDEWGVGLVASSIMGGVTLSSLVAGAAADAVGRVPVALVGEATLLVGVGASAVAPSATLLAMAQLVAGMGAGICAVAKPLWVVESTPEWARGTLLAAWSLFFSSGVGTASLARILLPSTFRASLALGMLPPLALGALFASGVATETPAFRAMQLARCRSHAVPSSSMSSAKSGGDGGGGGGGRWEPRPTAAMASTQQSAAADAKAEGLPAAPPPRPALSAYAACAVLAWLAAMPGDVIVKAALPLTLQAIGLDEPGWALAPAPAIPNHTEHAAAATAAAATAAAATAAAGTARLWAITLLNLTNLAGVALATALVDFVGCRTLLLRGGAAAVAGLLGAGAWGAWVACVPSLSWAWAWPDAPLPAGLVSTGWLCLYVLGLEAGPLCMFWVVTPTLFETHARGFGLAFGVTVLHALQVMTTEHTERH